jgi:Rod binding domain-containing protein
MPIIPPAAAVDPATWAAATTVRPATAGNVGGANNDRYAATSGQSAAKAKEVGQQFEALYLRQMLEECMPKDSEALFGNGTAGTVWRSMLADNLATTLSKTGTIGLAQMVIKPATTEPEGK